MVNKNKDLTRKQLLAEGKYIKLYKGVDTWFKRINEYGKKKVKLKFVNAQGASIIPDMELPETMASSKNNEEAKLVVAGNLQGLKFEQEGMYRVQLCVNDEIHELPFSVLR